MNAFRPNEKKNENLQVGNAWQLLGFEGRAVFKETTLRAHQALEILERRPDLLAPQQLACLHQAMNRRCVHRPNNRHRRVEITHVAQELMRQK